MMNDIVIAFLTIIAGATLGILFFGGLWFTVRKSVTMNNPALLVLGSMLLRVTIALFGFYYIAQGSWRRLLFCLLGFIAARFMVLFVTKYMESKRTRLKMEVGNEA